MPSVAIPKGSGEEGTVPGLHVLRDPVPTGVAAKALGAIVGAEAKLAEEADSDNCGNGVFQDQQAFRVLNVWIVSLPRPVDQRVPRVGDGPRPWLGGPDVRSRRRCGQPRLVPPTDSQATARGTT